MTVYRAKRLLTRAFVFAILLVIACLFVLPFVWLLFTSFKSNQEIYHTPITIFPNQVVLTQYFYIVKQLPQFFVYLKNSVIVSTTVVVLTLILSATCGYALGRKSFRGSGLIMAAIVIMMSLPWAIYLIPIYVIAAQLRLLNTRLVLVIYYAGLSLPLGIFMMRGGFRFLPKELEDSARIDGCSELQSFFRILLPLVKAGLASVAILTFLFSWEEFLYALTLAPDFTTLAVGITYLQAEGQSWAFGVLSGVILIGIIPTLVVFILFQKYLVKGLLEGAIKG